MKLASQPTKQPTKAVTKVRAAGGVVWRVRDGEVEILLVHRPRYDDWSFPKGKLIAGEKYRDAAIREVTEETGLVIALGEEIASARYVDANGRPKKVRYWAMTVVGGTFEPNDEVDRVAWTSLARVGRRLTYEHDVDVLESFRVHVLGASASRS